MPIDLSVIDPTLNMIETILSGIKTDKNSTDETRRIASQLGEKVTHYRSQHLAQTQ